MKLFDHMFLFYVQLYALSMCFGVKWYVAARMCQASLYGGTSLCKIL